jgi:ABC-type amino acid transport system permease subunit
MVGKTLKQTIVHNFVGGIFYGLGLTVGIAVLAYLLSLLVGALGGLPVVGDFLADIVNATLDALQGK